jgi:hypothetical protein
LWHVQNITLASHANDGDLKHLKDAVDSVEKEGEVGGSLCQEAKRLYTRFNAEVGALLHSCRRRVSLPWACRCAHAVRRVGGQVSMGDGVELCKSALSDVERKVRKYAEEDPTELPMNTVKEGDAEVQRRSLTKQEQALAKLGAANADLATLVVRRYRHVSIVSRFPVWSCDSRRSPLVGTAVHAS